VAPRLTEELETVSARTGLPIVLDEGGRMGAGLGVRRAPTVVFLLDGVPFGRLDWPFTEQELRDGLQELSAAPRAGPWLYLNKAVSLGTLPSLDAQPVDFDEIAGPFLISFFNPLCPPCWEALPALVALGEEIRVVLAVMAAPLSADDGRRLRETGLKAVLDDNGELARRLTVRVTPTHVILDRAGVIRWVHEGVVELEGLRSAVVAVLSEDGRDE
jgi:thiol-disulfide isomerase/thioredoxin